MNHQTSESTDALITEIESLRWKVQDLEKELSKVKDELADTKSKIT